MNNSMQELVPDHSDLATVSNGEVLTMRANDALVDFERELALVDKRVEYVNKIKQVAMKLTNQSDWVKMGGALYLQGTGAEKIAAAFNVGWKILEMKREELAGGHYAYVYTMMFSHNNRHLEIIGSRSSSSPFFSRKGKDEKGNVIYKNIEEIDQENVKKAAYTNCIANGVKRILGLRNITQEEIGSKISNAGMTTNVDYNNSTEDRSIISAKQVGYARKLCKDIGFSPDQLNKFLEEKAFSVKADKIPEMPRSEAKVFIDELIKMKNGEV